MAQERKQTSSNGRIGHLAAPSIPEQYFERFEAARLALNIRRMAVFTALLAVANMILLLLSHFVALPAVEMPLSRDAWTSTVAAIIAVNVVFCIFYGMLGLGWIKERGAMGVLIQLGICFNAFAHVILYAFGLFTAQLTLGLLVFLLLLAAVPVLSRRQAVVTIAAATACGIAAVLAQQAFLGSSGALPGAVLPGSLTGFAAADALAVLLLVAAVSILASLASNCNFTYEFLQTVAVEVHGTGVRQAVAKRTRELEDKAQALGSALETKSRFLLNMSRDMREPVGAIVALSRIAQKCLGEGDAAKALECQQRLDKQACSLLGTLGDTYELLSIEGGAVKLSTDSFMFRAAMEDVHESVGAKAAAKGCHFVSNVDLLPELVVSGDRQRLGQILLNVAENAVESTPEGGSISFEVSCLEDDEAEATFSFTFADDGSGISPERMECLFKAFEHMEEASCLWQCGGLGLAISSALVNEMGGKISVSSAPGEGSVFSFILSFVKSELLSGGGFAPGKLSGKHILLAEDIAINRLALRELLAGTGAVLDEAEDGLEAVSMFEHSTLSYYDIIFMDLLMPRLGGVEAAKAIRALERSDAQSVPIIALSANGADRDGEHLRRSGINEQTSKPLDLATIAKLLRKYAK